jgi:hypothetical protein
VISGKLLAVLGEVPKDANSPFASTAFPLENLDPTPGDRVTRTYSTICGTQRVRQIPRKNQLVNSL